MSWMGGNTAPAPEHSPIFTTPMESLAFVDGATPVPGRDRAVVVFEEELAEFLQPP